MANFFGMDTHFSFDLQGVLRNRGLEEHGRVQKVIDSEVLRLNDKYVPFDTGALKDSGLSQTQLGSGMVKYFTPYARKHYYIPMQHEGQRCDYWFERMKASGGKEKILAAARREAGAQ